jgi:hypothetical protein
MRRFVTGLLIVVSAASLLLASTSLWTRRAVINTEVFVSNVETMVDLPEVEARINERVTATVLETDGVQDAVDELVDLLPPRLQTFAPTVESGVGDVVSAGVQRLLTNDPFRPLTRAALTSAHTQLVNGEPVEFTLGQAKELVPDSAQDGLAGQILDLLPDDVGVTLLTPADAPEVYNAIDLLKSVWWWLGLLSLATLAGALGVSRHRRRTARAWAVTTSVVLLLLLITLRVARGRVVAAAQPENRDAVGAVYDVLAQSLRSWTLWLLAAVLLVLVLTLVWGRLGIVAGVRRGIASARDHLQQRRERRAAQAGAEPGAEPAAGEPWPRRFAAGSRAFAEGLDLPERTERLGAFVRDHHPQARWAGISVGAVVLLFWPAPTLSVLIWIAALVALWLGALEWLRNRAPEPAPAEPAAAGEPGPAVPAGAGDGARPVLPVSRPAPEAGPPAPPPVTPASLPFLNDRLDLLVRLGAAREAGVLTEQEFTREKERLMSV